LSLDPPGSPGGPGAPAPLQADDLRALARKYEALVVLRQARDHGDEAHPSEVLRDLSVEFPGSLRELDTLGLPELRRRAAAASAAGDGAATEPWMSWIVTFHRLLAAGLLIKRTAGSRHAPTIDEGARARLLEEASLRAGLRVDVVLFAAFVRPPGGRLAPLVLREVALRFAVPVDEVAHTLFPSRRAGPRA
jgi:hypothetical protein